MIFREPWLTIGAVLILWQATFALATLCLWFLHMEISNPIDSFYERLSYLILGIGCSISGAADYARIRRESKAAQKTRKAP